MNDECVICGAPLEYFEKEQPVVCAVCGKKEHSNTRCADGHYICDECHMSGIDAVISLCENESSSDPVIIFEKITYLPFCHMHGPEHHVIVCASLLTAYKNAGGNIDLKDALNEAVNRAKSVPGGACGFWGACGAGIGAGIFVSVITKSTPLSYKPYAYSNKMTANALAAIAEAGGPRCCKRNSYLALHAAADFVKENFGIGMQNSKAVCARSKQNNQCIKKRCRFYKQKEAHNL